MARRGPPIDRGWAWVIAAGLFMKCFLNGGFLKSYGVFFSAFSDTFGRSASETQLVRSARSAMATLTGPFGTALSEKFTERAVVIAGAVSMSLGFILAFFATSLEMLIFTFGIFAGIGVSLINGPSKVCLGRYFDKKRGRAYSLALVGTAIGQIAIPPLVSFLLATYSLRGTMLIYGGLFLNVIISGALMRPLSSYSSADENESHAQDKNNSTDSGVVDSESNQDELDDPSVHKKSAFLEKCDHRSVTENKSIPSTPDSYKRHLKLLDCGPDDHFKGSGLSISDRVRDLGSHLSINTLPQDDPLQVEIVSDEAPTTKPSVCSTLVAFFKSVFDRAVLGNPLYILFVVCTSLCMTAVANQVTFIVPRAEEYGMSREMAAILLSIIGGCDVVGRLLLGVLADVKCLASHHVMAIGVTITAITMYALPFTETFTEMAVVAVIFGIFGSTHAILNLSVMVDFVGKDLLAKAVGMSIFFYGGSATIMAPLLGLVKDRSGSFSTVFYVTASMQIVAAILLVTCEPPARKYVTRKKQRETQQLDR